MVYIQSYDIVQESFGEEAYSQVKVEWEFGDQLPDLVEIYIGSTKSQVRIVNCERSVTLLAPRREMAKVRVCPRLIASQTDGQDVFKETMPYNRMQEEEVHWENFCLRGFLCTC